MAPFPYVHIYCPCADSINLQEENEPFSKFLHPDCKINTEDLRTSFSLHPLQNLYFCEECYAIRCPRCIQEETVSYFCPNCLFEVPRSNMRGFIYTSKLYSNIYRCMRNCFQCPICFASLSVIELEENMNKGNLNSDEKSHSYILECSYCHWTSVEVNMIFEKPTGLNTQLKNYSPESSRKKSFYDKLKAHYQEMYGALKLHTNDRSKISNLMDIYERISKKRIFQSKKKINILNFNEDSRNLQDDQEIIKKMAKMKNLNEIATIKQRSNQLHHVIFKNDLKPIPYLLRTKRSKHCRLCKSTLISPENKPTSAKFRIKLVAINFLPSISLKCFPGPLSNCSPGKLSPNVTNIFLLTVTNPLYEKIKVFLATPQQTSGKYNHSVTILCPEFEVGANKDTFDDISTTKFIEKDTTKMPLSGTLWDCGKNWTTVVLEIIPSEVFSDSINFNDNLIEISIFVKVIYDISLDKNEFKHMDPNIKREIISKEIGFWGVIGLGRVLQSTKTPRE
ncbi:hypothetical protein PCANB_002869 [Pneumocystis canis]|nr:hypothetical protein PCK1_002860 [Pneumocystis canis]KAG5438381.1 hypothetical protein PCANB_002869 [Pneumocystis canis]